MAALEEKVIGNTLKIASSALEVELNPTSPMVVSYRSIQNGAVLCAAPGESAPEVVFYDGDADVYRSSTDEGVSLKCAVFQANRTVVYSCRLFWEDQEAVNFDLTFSVRNNVLQVKSQLIRELGNFAITSIKMPLVAVYASQPGAKLALTTHSGRLVDIAKTEPMTHLHKVDWFEITPHEMAYDEDILGMVSLQSIDNNIISEITDGPEKAGKLLVEFNHRHKAINPELLFLAQDETTCTVTIIGKTGSEPVDWTLGAAVVRNSVTENIKDLYTNSFTYKLLLDVPRGTTYTTFTEAFDFIKRVNRLTGGVRQIAYLIGWQHEGHDTGYPDVFTINKKLGGIEDLHDLIKKGEDCNAIISFHDNYHDTYEDSPSWDPSIVATESDGSLAKGGIWSYHQAYVIGAAKYAEEAAERVERTVEMYSLKTSVHLDVLTDNPDRIDFDPYLPASREDNCYGKIAIISAWNRLGIDVTSEILTFPFVERMSHFWAVECRPKPIWTSEERIPLVPMIYHGKVTVGGHYNSDIELLELLINGWTYSTDFQKESTDEFIMNPFYLINLPWSILAKREITGYKKNGCVEHVIYGPDTYIEIDRDKVSYEVVVDGVQIAKDFSTFASLPDGRIAVYSRDGANISVTLPQGCDNPSIETIEGARVPEFTVNGRKLEFVAEAKTPYWVSC